MNAFRNDTQDPSPLIRALAVRTMGCINVKDEENQARGADVVQNFGTTPLDSVQGAG